MQTTTKLLFTREDLPAIRTRYQEGWYKEAYEELIYRADILLNNDSPALDLIAPGHGYGTSARQLEFKTTTLAMAGFLSGNEAYLRRGAEVYMNTITQFHLDDFNRFNGHLCVGDAGRAEALAYDLLCEYLTDEQRKYALNELDQIGGWLYGFQSAWGRPHYGVQSCNHNTVHFGGLGLCALILGDRQDWLDKAVFQVRAFFKHATDATGFMTEGISYGCYGLLGAIPFCEAYRRATGVDLVAENSKNALIPNQLFAQTLPTQNKMVALNDNSDLLPNMCGMMYLITKFRNGAALWWLQHITGKDGDGNYGGGERGKMGSGTTLAFVLLFSDPTLTPVSPGEAGIPVTQRFESGRLFARESWTDKNKSLFFFTSGWDHHRGHNHCDQNSFAFFAQGEEFLIDPGTIPTLTECHNAVIINGEGQACASHGEILEMEDRGRSVFVAGDATEAYDWSKNIVGYARRNILYVKGDIPYLVIFDDIQTENDKSNDYAFMAHTGLDNELQIGDNEIVITGSRTGATCRLKFVNPGQVETGITDLSGREVYRYVANHKYADIYQEAYARATALSPEFVTVITAAPAGMSHPKIRAEGDARGMQLSITFADGHSDTIALDQYNIRLCD